MTHVFLRVAPVNVRSQKRWKTLGRTEPQLKRVPTKITHGKMQLQNLKWIIEGTKVNKQGCPRKESESIPLVLVVLLYFAWTFHFESRVIIIWASYIAHNLGEHVFFDHFSREYAWIGFFNQGSWDKPPPLFRKARREASQLNRESQEVEGGGVEDG